MQGHFNQCIYFGRCIIYYLSHNKIDVVVYKTSLIYAKARNRLKYSFWQKLDKVFLICSGIKSSQQTLNFEFLFIWNPMSLKYQRFTPSGCKNIRIRQTECVAIIQLIFRKYRRILKDRNHRVETGFLFNYIMDFFHNQVSTFYMLTDRIGII